MKLIYRPVVKEVAHILSGNKMWFVIYNYPFIHLFASSSTKTTPYNVLCLYVLNATRYQNGLVLTEIRK